MRPKTAITRSKSGGKTNRSPLDHRPGLKLGFVIATLIVLAAAQAATEAAQAATEAAQAATEAAQAAMEAAQAATEAAQAAMEVAQAAMEVAQAAMEAAQAAMEVAQAAMEAAEAGIEAVQLRHRHCDLTNYRMHWLNPLQTHLSLQREDQCQGPLRL
jgi:hypothetical protein